MSHTQSWRLIIDGPLPPALNMGFDEAIMMSVEKGMAPPTLRFYAWATPALSIGYSQPLLRVVDMSACKSLGVEVVRRLTGGRAVLHDDEVTYSVIAPQGLLPNGVRASYRWVAEALRDGLSRLGLNAEISRPPRGDHHAGQAVGGGACYDAPAWCEITIGGRKLVGSAQVRRNAVFLQHGSIPIVFDARRTAELLLPCDPAGREDMARHLEKRGAGLCCLLDPLPERGAIIQSLAEGFRRVHGLLLHHARPSPEEAAMAAHLVQVKYGDWGWTARR